MTIPTTMERIPLKTDPDGVARVDGTRVTLDTIVKPLRKVQLQKRSYNSTHP